MKTLNFKKNQSFFAKQLEQTRSHCKFNHTHSSSKVRDKSHLKHLKHLKQLK